MKDIMQRFEGIGLAAPQVGLLRRIIVIDEATIARERDRNRPAPTNRYLTLVNPRIIGLSDEEAEIEEGCLSLPTIYASVIRPERVEIEFEDADGNTLRRSEDGMLGRCILHEIDHLDGRLFSDYLSPLKRQMIRSRLKKIKGEK
jgi:peptide deformylase